MSFGSKLYDKCSDGRNNVNDWAGDSGLIVITVSIGKKSGSSGALLRHRPLGTVQASFPAYGSSHSSAPWAGTG
ncbi:hypothetical protein E1J61_25260 [Cupriavidus sp. L7L]|nr:hypothetical protein E1J61_25260 [Cupriavidus sp. L7L]